MGIPAPEPGSPATRQCSLCIWGGGLRELEWVPRALGFCLDPAPPPQAFSDFPNALELSLEPQAPSGRGTTALGLEGYARAHRYRTAWETGRSRQSNSQCRGVEEKDSLASVGGSTGSTWRCQYELDVFTQCPSLSVRRAAPLVLGVSWAGPGPSIPGSYLSPQTVAWSSQTPDPKSWSRNLEPCFCPLYSLPP